MLGPYCSSFAVDTSWSSHPTRNTIAPIVGMSPNTQSWNPRGHAMPEPKLVGPEVSPADKLGQSRFLWDSPQNRRKRHVRLSLAGVMEHEWQGSTDSQSLCLTEEASSREWKWQAKMRDTGQLPLWPWGVPYSRAPCVPDTPLPKALEMPQCPSSELVSSCQRISLHLG